jgi:putative cell wall-binding protein
MYKNNVFKTVSITIFLILTLNFKVNAFTIPYVKRLYGENRYKTNLEINKYGWNKSKYAIIASGEDFADALCAAPLSKKYDAPIFLVDKCNIKSNIINQIKNFEIEKVFIIGGPGVVSESIKNEINKIGITTERLYGQDRYETCIKVAEKLNNKSNLFLVSGENFPDALSIAPIAAKYESPIILTKSSCLPKSTKMYVTKEFFNKIYVIGGEAVLGDGILKDFRNYKRLSGKNRYETNLSILNEFSNELDFTNLYIASAENFPDALSGAALASHNKSSILLISNSPLKSSLDFISSNINNIREIVVLGGKGVVSDNVLKSIYNNINYYDTLNENNYIIEKDINIKNDNCETINKLELQINLGPISQSVYQKNERVEVYGPGASIVKDSNNNYKVMINISYIASGQTVNYKIYRMFTNSEVKYKTDLSNTSSDYSYFSEYDKYTSSEDKIESNNPLIISKSKEIVGSEKNPYIKAKKIFEFINTKIQYDYEYEYNYDYSEDSQGALNTITSGKGVCGGFARLFTAMCRSVGIPARVVFGYHIPHEDISNNYMDTLWYKHAWCEFYLPEYGWVIADPTLKKRDCYGNIIPNFDYFANNEKGDHFIESINDASYSFSYYGNCPIRKENIIEKSYIKKTY